MRELTIACGFAACALVSCFPQGACSSDPSFVDYCGPGDATCQGKILDSNHWQSGPIDAKWLDFSREKVILMHFRDAQTGAVLSGTFGWADIGLSITSSLSELPQQYVPCAGSNCEANPLADGSGVYVKNDTCSDYFVYVYVTLYPAADASAE